MIFSDLSLYERSSTKFNSVGHVIRVSYFLMALSTFVVLCFTNISSIIGKKIDIDEIYIKEIVAFSNFFGRILS